MPEKLEVVEIDWERLRLPEDYILPPVSKPKIRRHKGHFIKGPLPYDWVCAASRVTPIAGLVGVGLWHVSALAESRTFRVTNKVEELAFCSRRSLYRALNGLERVGLITVNRSRGHRPLVTLLPMQEDSKGSLFSVCQT
jgi:hypothetical protein